MSAIFLNLDDVRNLLVELGKPKASDFENYDAVKVIATGLGVTNDYLHMWMSLPPLGKPQGVHFKKRAFIDLAKIVKDRDLSQLKHTQRLDMLATIFGRRADAFMHQLKAETSSLGKNASLDMVSNNVPFRFLSGMAFSHAELWQNEVKRGKGLYVIASDAWNAAYVMAATETQFRLHERRSTSLRNFADFDDYGSHAGEKRMEMFTSLRRKADVVCIDNLRSDDDVDFVLGLAPHRTTIVTAEPGAAMNLLRKRASNQARDENIPVVILTLTSPPGVIGMTGELGSTFESFSVTPSSYGR